MYDMSKLPNIHVIRIPNGKYRENWVGKLFK